MSLFARYFTERQLTHAQFARVRRVPPRKRRKSSVAVEIEPNRTTPDTLPPRLQKPLAVSTRLLAPKPVTPVPDEFEFPDPKSPGMTTPATEEAQSPVSGGRMALTPAVSNHATGLLLLGGADDQHAY